MDKNYTSIPKASFSGLNAQNPEGRLISTLDMAMDDLAGKVSAAEFGFERLADKLKPVRSMSEATSTGESPSQAPNCQMEERILQMALRIQSLQRQIDLVNMQVCV